MVVWLYSSCGAEVEIFSDNWVNTMMTADDLATSRQVISGHGIDLASTRSIPLLLASPGHQQSLTLYDKQILYIITHVTDSVRQANCPTILLSRNHM